MIFDLSKLGDRTEKFIDVALGGLSLVSDRVGDKIQRDKVVDILTFIKIIIQQIEHVYEGKLDPDTVKAEFVRFQNYLSQNDAIADKALREKFAILADERHKKP